VGSKLTVLAAVIAAARLAAADDLKDGIDLYKAGKYADAVTTLRRAYAAAPKPDTLFALAQAERLAGDCKTAATHYHQVIEQVSDLNVAKLVQQTLALCEKNEPRPAETKSEPKSESKAEPQVVTKTVVHDVGHTDTLAASLFATGTLALGAAGGLYLAAAANRNGAEKARLFDDYTALSDRADVERTAMFVAGGVGVALIGVAVYRWTRSDAPKTDVAVVPSQHGGTLWVTSRF
jgi:tetratricopeptide (TPR) repeat protein